MAYLIHTEGKQSMHLFLADRNKTKKAWWTYNIYEAMVFQKQSAAEIQRKKLRYNNPQVISMYEAKILEQENDFNHDDTHPFSSEALGQW